MNRKILIGGAWPYANYLLHIGHLAALLPGDVIARYYRGNGDDVIYVSGTDSHGTPITERAKKEGKKPEEIANYYHEEFVKSFNNLMFSYDLYTLTDTEYHKEEVKRLFTKLYENGYLYEKYVKQSYCEKCASFLSDREIEGICPYCGSVCNIEQCDNCLNTLTEESVKNKVCKTCKSSLIEKDNKHLYFRLSAFQEDIKKLVNERNDKWRKQAVGETLKFLEMGLIDRSATRQLEWGIDIPVPGYEDKKIYVWFEAVLGYITTCKKVCENRNIDFDSFIKDENLISYYIHGKDNIPFHTVIYPSLILGLKENYNLPNYIISSGYVNMNDEKMSKSKGNLVTANELLDMYDVDTIRYYMIANGPEKKDINFTKEDLENAHNKFLVGVLGNFVNRNLSFINKKFDGIIKEGNIDETIINKTRETYKVVSEEIEKGELKNSLDIIFDYIGLGNKYYDENEPWNLVKTDINKFNDVTYTCVYMMANIANLINPFMPKTSLKIKNILNLKEFSWKEEMISGDIKLNEVPLLFNRIENK